MKLGTHGAVQPGPPDGSCEQPGPLGPSQQVSGQVRAGSGGQSGGWAKRNGGHASAVPPPLMGLQNPLLLSLGWWLSSAEVQVQMCAMACWRGTPMPHSVWCGVLQGGRAEHGTKPLHGLRSVGSNKRLPVNCVFVVPGIYRFCRGGAQHLGCNSVLQGQSIAKILLLPTSPLLFHGHQCQCQNLPRAPQGSPGCSQSMLRAVTGAGQLSAVRGGEGCVVHLWEVLGFGCAPHHCITPALGLTPETCQMPFPAQHVSATSGLDTKERG